MKLKIIVLASIFVGTTYTSYSQTQTNYSGTSDEETDAIVNLLGVQKKQAVAQLVHVSGKDSVAFWKIYDEYQKENNKTAKARLQLYESTANAYSNMTPAIADSLASQYFKNRFEQEKSLQDRVQESLVLLNCYENNMTLQVLATFHLGIYDRILDMYLLPISSR